MPERITTTRQAISGRLHDLEHDSDHHAERHEIEKALRGLSVLEVETQQWAAIRPDWNKKLDFCLSRFVTVIFCWRMRRLRFGTAD
jgi:hypothetical protein